jgi:hypothetical protein
MIVRYALLEVSSNGLLSYSTDVGTTTVDCQFAASTASVNGKTRIAVAMRVVLRRGIKCSY